MGAPKTANAAQKHTYFTPFEVAVHNKPDDCWVSVFGRVLDLTKLVKNSGGPDAEPILRAAGSDVSHWFDAGTGDVKQHICPVTKLQAPYCPQGRFTQVAPIEPTSSWPTDLQLPWWRDAQYEVGLLSSQCRLVRVLNVLTKQEHTLEVPGEEALLAIQDRHKKLNAHSEAYIWKAFVVTATGKRDLRVLDMTKTLAQNGLPDESDLTRDYRLPEEMVMPVLMLYWTDDLTAF